MTQAWNAKKIPVDGYKDLPKLSEPSGYVCVVWDTDTGNVHISQWSQPTYAINRWRKRVSKSSPDQYELIRIFEADDAIALKKSLYDHFKDKWTGRAPGWFQLDSSQLHEVDQIAAQDSIHLVADERWNLSYFPGNTYEDLPKLELPRGYVYVAHDLYTKNHKIGYTSYPAKRIDYLEKKASGDVEFVHILQSERVRETEAYLHEQFQLFNTEPRREQWEWFRLNKVHLQKIQNWAKQQPRYRSHLSASRASSKRGYEQQAHIPPEQIAAKGGTKASNDTSRQEPHTLTPKQSAHKKRVTVLVALAAACLGLILGYFIGFGDTRPVSSNTAADPALEPLALAPATPSVTPEPLIVEENISAAVIAPAPACYFVYACPSFECDIVGQLGSLDNIRFVRCVTEVSNDDKEWIEVQFENGLAFVKDRECSSNGYTPFLEETPPPTDSDSAFACDCDKKCQDMTSCAEAFFQLNECGCIFRDYDEDGIPCESICLCE